MSFVGPRYLLNPTVKEDCNIFSVKNFGISLVKQEDILQKLVFMNNFNEISMWVEINSKNQKFIANPYGSTDTDRMGCLFYVQEPIARAIKGQNDRKNGRELKLRKAADTADYAAIANVLASTAWTYWQDHGFFSEKNLKNELSKLSEIKNREKNEQKKEFQIAQIDKIGTILNFEKAKKKGAFQVAFDYAETEEILNIINFED